MSYFFNSRKNKYGNKKIKTSNNGSFDSRLELSHYEQLLWLEKAKKIKDLQRQVSIKLAKSPKCRIVYKADFVFYDIENKEWVIMDSKGFVTDSFRLKKAWLLDNFTNFRFEIVYKNKQDVEYPYNDEGINFEDYIKNYKKL
ncbi:DUF1064 domain-containing protein [Campylobacter coli]|nr:DUF1064 domain-containing protein [Campylobacter coli]EGT1666674.1 DUF1064 domain-containing protein [Campylobacter jejuni]